jgi:hypothetical protein
MFYDGEAKAKKKKITEASPLLYILKLWVGTAAENCVLDRSIAALSVSSSGIRLQISIFGVACSARWSSANCRSIHA